MYRAGGEAQAFIWTSSQCLCLEATPASLHTFLLTFRQDHACRLCLPARSLPCRRSEELSWHPEGTGAGVAPPRGAPPPAPRLRSSARVLTAGAAWPAFVSVRSLRFEKQAVEGGSEAESRSSACEPGATMVPQPLSSPGGPQPLSSQGGSLSVLPSLLSGAVVYPFKMLRSCLSHIAVFYLRGFQV